MARRSFSTMTPGTAILVGLFAFPAFGQGDVTLRGEVRTKDGQVIPFGVNISLENSQGMPVASRMADTAGNFAFEALQAGTYSMTVSADKFQPHEQTLDLSFHGITYMVKVFLSPANRTAVNVAALPARSDEAAPRLARKEFEKGDHALHEKKLPEARRHLEKALAVYPCYARAEEALAQVDLAERKLESAEGSFKKAIQCDNTFLDSFSELAQLYLVEKKLPESQSVIQEGLRLSPTAWLLHYQLGSVHYGMGKYREALQDYLAAQSFHPKMPADFHAKIANAYLKTGDYSKALAEMDAYLRLDPDGGYAPSARKLAAMMRKDGVTAAPASPSGPPAAAKP